eukprot:8337876-Alexandrium_andersonii.AAC.1
MPPPPPPPKNCSAKTIPRLILGRGPLSSRTRQRSKPCWRSVALQGPEPLTVAPASLAAGR